MRQLTKKGQVINGLSVAIGAIVGLAITLAIGLYVLSSVGDSMTTNSAAQNATEDIVDKLADAPVWIGILVIVIFAGAVLYFVKMNQ
jgi:hypothetical protein